jgi:ketosteroid isomerase-like protein
MSHQNVEIVRQIFASAAPFTSDPRLLRGVEQMRAFRDAGPWGRSLSFAAERFFDVDHERVLVFVRGTAAGRQSGTPVESKVAHEFTLRQGLIVRIKVYPDQAEALKTLGLEA